MKQEVKKVVEGQAEIVCVDGQVFYNPVQEFNRDMSIAAINTWISGSHPRRLEKIAVLEGLAATGLRSMRYAKELVFPESTSLSIVANDFDPKAVETIKASIKHNNVADRVTASIGDAK